MWELRFELHGPARVPVIPGHGQLSHGLREGARPVWFAQDFLCFHTASLES